MKNIKTIYRLGVSIWAVIVLVVLSCEYQKQSDNMIIRFQNEHQQNLPVFSDFVFVYQETEPQNSFRIIYSGSCIEKNIELSDYERWIVESIVAGEAGNQNYEGKLGVASCIYNACIQNSLTPSQVQHKYQYQGWYDINDYNIQQPELASEVKQAVSQVFDSNNPIDNSILWFYNPKYGYSSFHESQQYKFTIQEHKFFAPWG